MKRIAVFLIAFAVILAGCSVVRESTKIEDENFAYELRKTEFNPDVIALDKATETFLKVVDRRDEILAQCPEPEPCPPPIKCPPPQECPDCKDKEGQADLVVDKPPATGCKETPSNTFLYKPIAQGGGPLVTLIEYRYKGQVVESWLEHNGQRIETGQFHTDEANGCRTHHRYSKVGSAYPSPLNVKARLKNGEVLTWHIPNAAARTEIAGVKVKA